MTIKNFGFLAFPAVLLGLSSCLSDDEKLYKDYTDWRNQNLEYIEKAAAATINGTKQYEQVTPPWDKNTMILMQWHNNRTLTQQNLVPMNNSTIDVKYILTTIEGDTIDSSYSQTTYGDSIFRCQPNEMITGFQVAVTSMHIGDSVTTVIPYTAGYGAVGQNKILPYSTLIFGIKLVDIYRWDASPK